MSLHSDEPTLNDQLDRYDLLKRIGDTIAECHPPYVIGVHGDWGAGKSSFLHQLHKYLADSCPQNVHSEFSGTCLDEEHRKHLTVIWFEAWRYQHEPAPIVALLQEIRSQLPRACKALETTKKLGEVTIRTALMSLDGFAKMIGVSGLSKITKTAQETGEAWEKDHYATALPSNAIREFLNHHLQQLLTGGKKVPQGRPKPRVVVLIDDLDRCEPEAAFRLLEGIKIYLNLESCVFVLGMNQSHMERAVAKQLKDAAMDEDPVVIAREYLEKLCQEICHLPNLIEPANFLKGWLPSGDERGAIASIVAGNPGCLPANPRKIKAVAHVMGRLIRQNSAETFSPGLPLNQHARRIVIFASLYQFHPDLYRLIEAYGITFYNTKLLPWSQGLTLAADEHPLLKREKLKRPMSMSASAADKQETQATPPKSPDLQPTHPDPVRGNVLRVQSLITQGGEITAPELKRYLLR